tara:strand:- start:16397 stop:16756 length:360 start_codon:yes stop_codon:yes gene_type:complete
MARIAGINLPNHKHIWIALTAVYGIGDTRAKFICQKVGIEATKKVKDLEEKELETIRQFIDEYQLEGDLRRENSINIKRLMDIGSYRGIRHRKGLPLRGQKTKNNSRTRKGPRKLLKSK